MTLHSTCISLSGVLTATCVHVFQLPESAYGSHCTSALSHTQAQQHKVSLPDTTTPPQHMCTCCRQSHGGHSNAVHLNDVFFAVHAALLAALTLIQCFIYERGHQRVSRVCASAIGCTVAASCVFLLLLWFDNQRFPLLTFLYWLSWVKMGVTFFKYMPQVYMHALLLNSHTAWHA